MSKIAKKIFYVWFGGDKPAAVNMCIKNWHEKLSDYEIIEVGENSKYFNFKKVYNDCKWFKTVYDRKMWAFVSDYVRCKVLYDYGGIYMDTDMTVEKDFSPLLDDKFFIGEEKPAFLSVGIFGCIPKYKLLGEVLDFYNNEIFKSSLYTLPEIMTAIYNRDKYENLKIYPREYFYPYNPFEPYFEKWSPDCVKKNTYAIHWWNASWFNDEMFFFLENKHKPEILEKLMRCENSPLTKQNITYIRFCRFIPFIKCNEVNGKISVFLFDFIPLFKCDKNKIRLFSLFPLFKIRRKDKMVIGK